MVVGLMVGSNLHRAIKIVESGGYIGLAVAVLLSVGALFWLRHKRGTEKKSKKETRAKH